MSITKDFEKRLLPHFNSTVYGKDETEALLGHARALEAMLKKVQWGFDGTCCPICGRLTVNKSGHHSDCALAKLLEGTNQ